ncbi:MAG: MFS transporter [Planctomycetaceae bacterium]|jgi:FSR family fosmidomycin resistance protein-like MFS transporter|nr:MFS transporter [Planctomycetaceae bacterium]
MKRTTTLAIVLTLTFAHLSNDLFQTFFQAIYPQLKESLLLTFTQIGFITLTFQFTSSICQPLVGIATDRRPFPYLLPIGMFLALIGVAMISFAQSFSAVLLSVGFIGLGSAVFHPEASRLVFMVSGARLGFFQSLFLVGGNVGGSLGALMAAIFIAPYGHGRSIWLTPIAIFTMIIMLPICRWYSRNLNCMKYPQKEKDSKTSSDLQSDSNIDSSLESGEEGSVVLSRSAVWGSLAILMTLIFSKYIYLACFRSYYTFYLIELYGISVRWSQTYLFLFLIAIGTGTLVGGHVGDYIGRKYVIWVSILGAFPFTICIPFVHSLFWTCVLSMLAGFILSSAFSAILLYAQELFPGRVGMIAGLFFGLAFGVAGVASVVLGIVADKYGIDFVFGICSLLPLLGLTTYLLPDLGRGKL